MFYGDSARTVVRIKSQGIYANILSAPRNMFALSHIKPYASIPVAYTSGDARVLARSDGGIGSTGTRTIGTATTYANLLGTGTLQATDGGVATTFCNGNLGLQRTATNGGTSTVACSATTIFTPGGNTYSRSRVVNGGF